MLSNGKLFSPEESNELQKSLIVPPDQQFQTEIRLTRSDEIYTISIVQFLQSGQNPDENNNNLDWVRCRGSSILNFDCYSIWQIMIIEHPAAKSDAVPSLKIFNIPSIEDITSHLQIHSWYNCDTKTNARIDSAMNNRQKLLRLNLDFITDRTLLFNLQTFSFADDKLKIRGFIRWIPKLISNTEQDKNKIKILDNFAPMTNLIPIPLTTKRLEQTQQEDDELSDDENVDETTLTGIANDLDDDSASKSIDNGVYTLTDFEKDDAETSSNKDEDEEDATESVDVRIDDYLDPNVENFEPAVSTKEIDSEEVKKEIEENIKNDLNELQALRNREKQRVQQLEAMDQLQENLDTAIQRVHTLNDQLKEIKRKKDHIQQITASIQTIQYTKIEKDIMCSFLISNQRLILNQLQSHTKDLDDYFNDKIPRMIFEEKRNTFTIILAGIQVHHKVFKEILQRILTLAKAKQRAIEFYQRHLNRITRSINRLLFQVTPNTKYWKHYSKIFYELLKAENVRYMTKFKDFIESKIREIGDLIITDSSVSPWTAIREVTNSMMKQNPFENEVERLKHQAFEKFIELNVSVQQLKLGKSPTKESLDTIQHFIEKMKRIFQEDPQYVGYKIQHFCLIPPLLQRMMIYYCCFALQLPLYESSKTLLRDIRKNTVVTISTSTGSGKSTLLPALLIADGYDRVLVTQPRRLPCKLISKRVNETMITDRNHFAAKLAGWAVSGDDDNARAKILYLTDGLLKERLLNDEKFITKHTTTRKSIVLFIDEVHERSVNIDLCLALIARMLKNNHSLIPKVKVIISSATLDASVPEIFAKIPDVNLKRFEIPLKNTLHPIKDIKRPNENILDVVKEILVKRDRRDQVLCFVSSTAEVHRCCKLLNELSQNTIVAYPLVQAQSPHEQEEALERGSIFFSTTVAETSLTFASLKYVVDTGTINVSTYNIQSQQAIDIQQKLYSIELETIVENIRKKHLQVLRSIDDRVTQRINKMVNVRHWTQIGQPLNVLPNPERKYSAVLVPLPFSSTTYQTILHQMQLIDINIHITSIEEIKNPDLEETYEGMKKLIARECVGNNPNERELFHATSGDAITGISEHGFDDRYFSRNGYWGHGAYFADDPRKSHGYAPADGGNNCVMFYNKVLLGKEAILPDTDQSLVSAPKDFHSVRGTEFKYTEYIIYRYGQALPYLKIIYSV